MTSMRFIWLDIPIRNNAASKTIDKKRKIIFKYCINFKIILFNISSKSESIN